VGLITHDGVPPVAVRFFTETAHDLLNNFNARIEQKEQAGKITTWERSTDKLYYTHKAAEWHSKAWFKATVSNDRLTFNIIKPKNANVTGLVYAYYHGHLTETFLNHFDRMFSTASSTALLTPEDNCS
jgi:hypothetical protein